MEKTSIAAATITNCVDFFHLYPKDYEFYMDELIHLWIAQGFFDHEEDAQLCFEEFVDKSKIIESSSVDTSTGRLRYKLIHFSLVSNDYYFRSDDSDSYYISSDTLHASIRDSFDPSCLTDLYHAENLRTLLILHDYKSRLDQLPRHLFLKLPLLMALDLSHTNIKELPSTIRYLKDLRYLNLSFTPITTLPNSLCTLSNLQTLDLRGCSKLICLPRSMSQLTKLRHLNVDVTCLLVFMPPGFGDLAELQTLPAFIVGKENGCHITELKQMVNLRGTFHILRLENVSNSKEAKQAALEQKKYLNKLELQWSKLQDGFELLENLCPYKEIQELEVIGYGGANFPSWIGKPLFTKLSNITIHDCRNCKVLPPLGQLPSLESLCISDMPAIKVIEHYFCGRNMCMESLNLDKIEFGTTSEHMSTSSMFQALPAFAALKNLTINVMPMLEKWCGIEEGDFPHLQNLNISNCPKLIAIPKLSHLKLLKKLEISLVPSLQSLSKEKLPTSLQYLVIIKCPLLKEKCLNDEVENWRKLGNIPNIWIDYQQITKVRKNQAENIQMEQIALFGRADATSTHEEKERKYLDRRNSLGSQPLEPLQPFYCPITKNVMVEPVETSSGQTFEKSAIVKWLAEGNKLCPLTMTPLNPEILRPNRTLRQSIEEWRDRSNNIIIASMKRSLLSHNEQEMLRILGQLQDLCEKKDSYREWVVLEGYIPLLIGLLKSEDHEIRKKALLILCLLAKDSDDIKEKIADVENAIGSVVNSIGRQHLSKYAVALLLELSKSSAICERIGKVQGCILYLVSSLSSDDLQVAGDAKELLQNLAFLDQNIIEMAKANYFKHLLQRLSSGPEDVKLIMAATLAELDMTDPNKAALFEEGALDPLIHLLSQSNSEMKKVAVRALRNLSCLPQNAFQMIRGRAVVPLLDLCRHSLIDPILKEEAEATIMNLSLSTRVHEPGKAHMALLENDDDIFRLFSLINMTGPNVQRIILHTFNAICQPPSAMEMRSKLRQSSALQVLIQLCEIDDFTVRANAVKLFYCLTQDDDVGTLSEYMSQKCITTLLKIVNHSNDEEEIAATMGIISNLPVDHAQITEWLLEAGALPIIFKILTDGNYNGLHKDQLIENAVGSICRFTVSTHQEWQRQAAHMGIISLLVQLLGFGTPLTKERVAISLAEFSRSSTGLSRPIERRGGFWCCLAPSKIGCPVHMGICTVKSSFCLVEAGAINPLVRVLGESDLRACEASLRALLTLIDGEKLQNGSRVLDEAKAIAPVIGLLSSPSLHLQEMALNALERIFGQVVGFKQKYGASAQMPLINITQRGTSAMKSLAARTLGHLDVLHQQSSYF